MCSFMLKREHMLILEAHTYIFIQIHLAACPWEVATRVRIRQEKQHW